MGSSQSSHADKHELKHANKSVASSLPEGVGGRKSHNTRVSVPHLRESVISLESQELHVAKLAGEHGVTTLDMPLPEDVALYEEEEEEVATTESESEEESDSEEEEDEEWEERLRILQDARDLKNVAAVFLHPEVPLDTNTSSRCYFDRASAPDDLTEDEMEEREAILAEAAALKKLSSHFLHPEKPVAAADPALFGRCYFDRPSAPEVVSEEDMVERELILKEAAALKNLAVDFHHPEKPVATADPTVFGRNFFGRPSAFVEDPEVASARIQVMEDLEHLKDAARTYLHPEIPVASGVGGRNFFHRASAPEGLTEEDAVERQMVLQEAAALREKAVQFRHPEHPVASTDPTLFGRSWFSRPAAPEWENEEAEAKDEVLKDAAALKQLARDYLHPEDKITTTDPTACARNYFTRPSGPEWETEEDAEVREQILQDAASFKRLASDYLHPELPVVIYADTKGRNFFLRPSAPEYESLEDASVRAEIMEDLRALKKLAVDFLHPELPAVIYASTTGRNFFTRPSTALQESPEDEKERARVLAECQALKASATNYMHPELPVKTTDGFACGRNFYSRPSAASYDDVTEAEHRAQILADCMALKTSATGFLHPELPVGTADGCACGRNYFTRASAPAYEDEDEGEARTDVLTDCAALKDSAMAFMHPERPVVTTDPFASGRNYFTRASAPTYDEEEAEDRSMILKEAEQLKHFARAYMHPELPVMTTSSTATGRNYFDRPGTHVHDQMIHTFPPHADDHHHSEHHHSELLDHFGMDEDFMFTDIREELAAPLAVAHGKVAAGDEGEEGKLSRSPSSVMLMNQEESVA